LGIALGKSLVAGPELRVWVPYTRHIAVRRTCRQQRQVLTRFGGLRVSLGGTERNVPFFLPILSGP
jgi:hypothetical protein